MKKHRIFFLENPVPLFHDFHFGKSCVFHFDDRQRIHQIAGISEFLLPPWNSFSMAAMPHTVPPACSTRLARPAAASPWAENHQ